MRNKFIILGIAFSIILAMIAKTQAIIRFDLENLRNQDEDLTRAYDIAKIQDAWQLILNSNATLSSIIVGIVDTGVDAAHQEFNHPRVDFGSSPTVALIDSSAPEGGHGTQVVGIMGANNVLGAGLSLPPDSPQMNGIISGILHENQYKLEIENYKAIGGKQTTGSFVALENILKRNPSVVNMSFGIIKCSAISWTRRQILGIGNDCYKTDDEFAAASEAYTRIFDAEKIKDTTLFISAAGNWDIDTHLNVLPATINLSNLMTIGATDLGDSRATFIPLIGAKSNFGSDIDVSAPGIHVYTTKPGNAYTNPKAILDVDAGTSVSAPFVTGVAAILKALEPEYQKYTPDLQMTPGKIKEILIKSADAINTGEPDKRLGSGCFNETPSTTGCRLNAYRAVAWYFPPASSTLSYSDLTSNSVKLNWTKNEDPDFSKYELYRVIIIDGVPQVALAAAVTDQNQTSFVDANLTPDTQYYYRLRTYDQVGLFSRSDLISFATPSLPFIVPFANITIDGDFSDWEGIPAAHIDPAGDSLGTLPGTDFTNFYLARDNEYLYFRVDFANGLPQEGDNIYYQINLDLPPRGPMKPGDSVVFFWNRYTQSWVTVLRLSDEATYTDIAALGGSSLETRARLDFIGNPDRLFVALHINENNQWVDWQKADFEAELEPIPPTPPPVSSILSITATTTDSVSLSWTQNADTDFKEYRLYRTTLGGGLPSALIAAIYNQPQTSFTDAELPFGIHDYYLETHYLSGLFLRSNDVRAELPFYIPYANITIDGDISDWQGIQPAIIDQVGDKLGSYSGTDISKVYLARDDVYLYLRIDLADGPPNPQYERPSIGFHTALHQNPDPQAVPGDYFLFGYFGYGSWQASLYVIGDYAYDQLAAAGPFFLEIRTSLSILSDLSFLYIATHTNFGQEGFDWTPWVKAIFSAP